MTGHLTLGVDRWSCSTSYISLGNRFTFERLAYRVGIQKSYLSRVMRTEGPNLSEDQLYAIAVDLGFSAEESHFLQLQLAHARSGLRARRDELAATIDGLRRAHQRSEAHISAPAVGPAELTEFFVNPELILTHMCLSLPRLRHDVRQIGSTLGLSGEELTANLAALERLGMVKLEDGGYRVQHDRMHLPVDSPVFRAYRSMQRLKSLERCQRLPSDRAYSFSVAFAANESTRQEIKQAFLGFLATVEKMAQGAPDEDLYQMNFDLFDWSR